MSEHYLKFASYAEAIAVIEANQPELLWNDNGIKKLRGSHNFAAVVVDCYHATGVMLQNEEEVEYPEQVLVPGYHINLKSNVGLPSYLTEFEVFPVTPSCTWGKL